MKTEPAVKARKAPVAFDLVARITLPAEGQTHLLRCAVDYRVEGSNQHSAAAIKIWLEVVKDWAERLT